MADESASTQPAPTSHGFFTTSAFATLAGITGGIVIISNAVGAVTDQPPKWMPVLLAAGAAVSSYFYAAWKRPASFRSTPFLLRIPVVVLNACLIYVTAFGVQGVLVSESVSIVDEGTDLAESEETTGGTTDETLAGGDSSRLGKQLVTDLGSQVRSLSTWESVMASATPTKLRRDRERPEHHDDRRADHRR